jgi:hypothetical protein
MFAPSDQMYLPFVVIDVSNHKVDVRRAKPAADGEPIAVRVQRVTSAAAAVRANIVRLIPGATRLPFEPVTR